MSQGKSTHRDHILATAGALFFRDGYRAVGVDTIVEKSGVAKMTLYRYFPSKDDLIVAYLEDSNLRFWAWFEGAVGQAAEATDQLVALYAALEALIATPQCLGCPFLNVTSEFPDLAHPGHQVALAHKQAVQDRLRAMAAAASAAEPEVLAMQLLLLMDGAFMRVRVFGMQQGAVPLVPAVRALLQAQGVETAV